MMWFGSPSHTAHVCGLTVMPTLSQPGLPQSLHCWWARSISAQSCVGPPSRTVQSLLMCTHSASTTSAAGGSDGLVDSLVGDGVGGV